jgi:hypothetical protein
LACGFVGDLGLERAAGFDEGFGFAAGFAEDFRFFFSPSGCPLIAGAESDWGLLGALL